MSEQASRYKGVRLYRDGPPLRAYALPTLLGLSLLLGAGSVAGALWLHGQPASIHHARWLDLASLGALLLLAPAGLAHRARARRRSAIEARFPDFVRDLAVSRRAGMTLVAGLESAAATDYGPLTVEIQRMCADVRRNATFEEAFSRFARRSHTPLVARVAALVQQASRVGGGVADVLMRSAEECREQLRLRQERRTNMSLYAAVIYVAFFVFLLVVGVLYVQLIPSLLGASESAGGLPAGFASSGVTTSDFRAIYFLAAMSQAVGGGILVGVLANGTAREGFVHSSILVAIAWAAFAWMG